MAKRRPKPKIVIDAVVAGCLARIRTGDVLTSVGVLCDYMDETGHPFAKRLRKAYTRLLTRDARWDTYDFSRSRRWTRWQAKAWDRRDVWWTVRDLFRRTWRTRALREYL